MHISREGHVYIFLADHGGVQSLILTWKVADFIHRHHGVNATFIQKMLLEVPDLLVVVVTDINEVVIGACICYGTMLKLTEKESVGAMVASWMTVEDGFETSGVEEAMRIKMMVWFKETYTCLALYILVVGNERAFPLTMAKFGFTEIDIVLSKIMMSMSSSGPNEASFHKQYFFDSIKKEKPGLHLHYYFNKASKKLYVNKEAYKNYVPDHLATPLAIDVSKWGHVPDGYLAAHYVTRRSEELVDLDSSSDDVTVNKELWQLIVDAVPGRIVASVVRTFVNQGVLTVVDLIAIIASGVFEELLCEDTRMAIRTQLDARDVMVEVVFED